MTDYELDKINAERRRRGLPLLSKIEAGRALTSTHRSVDSGFDSTDFLIGYTTGIPMPSSGGMLGAMLHDSGRTSDDPPATTVVYDTPSVPDPAPSYDSLSSDSSSGSSE